MVSSSEAMGSEPNLNQQPDQRRSANALIVGAGQGIGLGFVHQLLQNNDANTAFGEVISPLKARFDRIYATYRDPQSELLKVCDSRLRCLSMDITDEAQIEAAVKEIKTETKTLQVVINCVGILHEGTMQPEKSLRQLNMEQLLQYFQVNSIGAVLLAKHVQPLLKHGDRAIFATISAKLGSIGDNYLGGWYGYRASKAALNMFMRTTAIEYKRTCPRTIVVTLHPGTTDTQLSRPFQRNVSSEKLFSVDRTVGQLLTVLHQLQENDSGGFFSWDGSRLPW